jgi:integrase/recombinase XerD
MIGPNPQQHSHEKTLQELSVEYRDWRRSLNTSLATLRSQYRSLTGFIRWLGDQYGISTAVEIQVEHLYEWQKYLPSKQGRQSQPIKARSVNNYIASVVGFLNYLVSQGCIQRNIPESLHYVKEPRALPGSVLSHFGIRKLLADIPDKRPRGCRNKTMLELLYTTGVRAGELLGLDVGDVDFLNATMLVTGKGNKQRVVPIGTTALLCLQNYIQNIRSRLLKDPAEKAMFLTFKGRRVPYRSFLGTVHSAARRAGITTHVSPHTFRRSFATELIRRGANMYHVKDMLGHESLNTLQQYVRLTIIDLKKTHRKYHPREHDVV